MEDFNFTVLFLNSDWFQDFDDAFLIVLQVAPFKDLRVFTSSELMIAVVIVEGVPVEVQFLIVRETLRSISADKLVRASEKSVFDLILGQLLRLNLIHRV